MTDKMIQTEGKKGRNAVYNLLDGQNYNKCPCGCDRCFPSKGNRKYFSRQCKDRIRNRQRYERQKEAIDLAIKILIHAGYKVVKE